MAQKAVFQAETTRKQVMLESYGFTAPMLVEQTLLVGEDDTLVLRLRIATENPEHPIGEYTAGTFLRSSIADVLVCWNTWQLALSLDKLDERLVPQLHTAGRCLISDQAEAKGVREIIKHVDQVIWDRLAKTPIPQDIVGLLFKPDPDIFRLDLALLDKDAKHVADYCNFRNFMPLHPTVQRIKKLIVQLRRLGASSLGTDIVFCAAAGVAEGRSDYLTNWCMDHFRINKLLNFRRSFHTRQEIERAVDNIIQFRPFLEAEREVATS